ncbi:methyltransferase domain-containing protein [Halarcobacter anaerophilus]|uniref:SAM-dependent methyltransferase n=1 Tax=Halarcobacter anaerophilus TaxID=877500 RepID=A0A4Q0Y053_9BACT|nr:SAM-dependent methyltransferase [Halarcobacter anaerophilus]QDF28667.1 hypothetical protein AANAER_1181 [Halarcobacter anaerophilus]RXJ63386.1 SAM-dependent methyltransferase [Halarcobacter anaerophilus]
MILQNVVPWGRNFEEYKAMFSLNTTDLSSSILGCADGPSSFNAEATKKNISVISFDPIFQFTKNEIKQRILDTAETVMKEVEQNKGTYIWKNISSVNELKNVRILAMTKFLEDYEAGKKEGRYIEGSLPNLPFEKKSFNLVLCSHFLFLYSEHLDLDFHLNAVLEMCSVGNEVRIFPLLDLKGNRSEYLKPLTEHLKKAGYQYKVEIVDYEFQKGGNEMLRIKSIK